MAAPDTTHTLAHERKLLMISLMTKNEDPILWLDQFIRVACGNYRSDTTKKKVIGGLLPANATIWYDHYCDKWKTFDDFVKAFEKGYQTKVYIQRMLATAHAYRQGPDESVHDLVYTMISLFRRANITDTGPQSDTGRNNSSNNSSGSFGHNLVLLFLIHPSPRFLFIFIACQFTGFESTIDLR
ncbi:hypothetical protein BGW42_007409 [Actinomortierella wolfii]|nr:hypothetical protein BGW42_007409 [Actinomortierella wolfii]